ncbi:MAG: Gfo/Idh/MocA family oxidoreductase [candidate division KSB1 bacterium]|nr:Gfo/Idh/MocA family oxidoreductase [candidate division KSB1 bacterium]MDZ7274470.1 Gfo/Idh/MocA family oxidoreductase [candidate division KSB1 bacterium]MDZ7284868.1 Gfo/Idh/MocA family oxidoreductase [candidate division KSB1 bacterium]MDZ7297712.1 Gfo/Idh/MocA family oxidoreductase [candidate division KSB1 bacterium]MDZ7308281.1 Gfo/Idh/MocA family oxidoreductase [candidate division KSB1 bacterium]
MQQRKIRWGILSTGRIAQAFAQSLAVLPDAQLHAVGSRRAAAAEAFGARFNVPRRHASYAALAADEEVEVIYIGTPHSLHAENCLLCLQAGKAVLCEKPFTINAAEAETVIQFARHQRRFLMEAMWTRFLPAVVQVREWLAEGMIGEPRLLLADFGFRAEFDPASRLFAPELGGGALLDVGIYPLALAAMIFGPPQRLASMAHLGPTGVDEQCGMILGYDGGALALLAAANRSETPKEATIIGSAGRITLHAPFFKTTRVTLARHGRPEQTVQAPYESFGYQYEAAEVMACLRAGRLESEIMPLDESLQLMQTMDEIRRQWGLRYPCEMT